MKNRRATSAAARAELAAAKEQGYYSIGNAAKLSGVTAKMIRHYESLGLIPRAARTAGDYRVYNAADIHTLRFIRRARGLGFSMSEIADLLGLWRDQRRASREVKRLATKHITELDARIEELQSMRNALADLAEHCAGNARPHCPILDDLGGIPAAPHDREGDK
ncbi:Cu(I)-responsive transcriptional regulator [Povalibacter uvarum]|uniref:Cu(I)-responsive transcriptional regulator n=1 Tax=Povalibacter uvarum TaxID=732238 RepID=A0A841HS14_9GAMM|nr:Cu(I)-responsive transcriptional regulator [Povalibacter uvarum]MBB6096161.1 Cu(I)-responsive transcriptional regulator [Povalibacter uvarum]